MRQEEPLIEGDYDSEGAYAPTILLVLRSIEGTKLLKELFDHLATAAPGTTVSLVSYPRVSLGAAIMDLNLSVTATTQARHLVRDDRGGFLWSCTNDEWQTASLLVEPLLHQRGHQYLTSEVDDDALVEVSYGERHG
jgi:hypothetical protein